MICLQALCKPPTFSQLQLHKGMHLEDVEVRERPEVLGVASGKPSKEGACQQGF